MFWEQVELASFSFDKGLSICIYMVSFEKKKRIIHPKVEFSHVPCDYAKSD